MPHRPLDRFSLLKKLTASGQTIFIYAMGFLVELGVVSMMTSGSRSGLNRSDVLVSFGGVIIARTVPGVLFRVFCWCERGFSWSVRGAVGFVDVVTGGDAATL